MSANLHAKRLRSNWKPFLFYVKGDYGNRTFWSTDTFVSDYADTQEGQEFHKWGQNLKIFEQLVSEFTYAGETICDPFLGGGTTAIAALKNKRRFVGIELDKQTFDVATNRINEVLK